MTGRPARVQRHQRECQQGPGHHTGGQVRLKTKGREPSADTTSHLRPARPQNRLEPRAALLEGQVRTGPRQKRSSLH